MLLKLRLTKLNINEQYQLLRALKWIKNPDKNLQKSIEFLEEEMNKDYDKLCRERGWSMML